MGSTTFDWSSSLGTNNNHINSPSATVTATLNGCSSGASLNGRVVVKIGCVYLDASGNYLGTNGQPLPSGQTYSKYAEVAAGSGGGSSPQTWSATASNHDAAAWCQSGKPVGAVSALYHYYTAVSCYSSCPGASVPNSYGPSGNPWTSITL